MCNFETSWYESEFFEHGVSFNYELLDELQSEGLILYDQEGMKVLNRGKEVIRVICSALDARLSERGQFKSFSKAI